MYSLHDLEITGISLAEILECETESVIGEHGTLMILACVDSEEMLYELPDCQEINVFLRTGGEKTVLFSGIMTDIRISEQAQMKTVRIEAKSRSWLMDRTRRSRSFQNTKMTYRALAWEILKCYEGENPKEQCSLIYAGAERKTEGLIVQYEETDWEFLKRVLSIAGLALTPDSRQEGIKLYAGVPSLTETAFSCHVRAMDKDMASYYLLKANGRDVRAADFTRYTVESEQLLGIFEPVCIGGNRLVAYSCRYLFGDQEMTGIYGLQSSGGLKRTASYPMHLIGVALPGEVVGVSGSKVRVLMEIDKGHKERAVYWFPYSTMSASPNGSGWYCMPEKGDKVRVYFPSKMEREAVALSAVSSYQAPQDGEKDRMEDPDSRYLRTKAGQELALAPGYIRLSCGQNAASATIYTNGRVFVNAQSLVKVQAHESLTLDAEEELSIHVNDKFHAYSTDGGEIAFAQGHILFKGTEVKFD